VGATCGAGASALGAASDFLHLLLFESLSKCQTHALSAVHDASSPWAAHPLFGLLQPTSDKVRAIITNAYLMLVSRDTSDVQTSSTITMRARNRDKPKTAPMNDALRKDEGRQALSLPPPGVFKSPTTGGC
jgi:hypothetical protein